MSQRTPHRFKHFKNQIARMRSRSWCVHNLPPPKKPVVAVEDYVYTAGIDPDFDDCVVAAGEACDGAAFMLSSIYASTKVGVVEGRANNACMLDPNDPGDPSPSYRLYGPVPTKPKPPRKPYTRKRKLANGITPKIDKPRRKQYESDSDYRLALRIWRWREDWRCSSS